MFAALVDDAKVTITFGFVIRQDDVNLVSLERRFVSGIVDTPRVCPFSNRLWVGSMPVERPRPSCGLLCVSIGSVTDDRPTAAPVGGGHV